MFIELSAVNVHYEKPSRASKSDDGDSDGVAFIDRGGVHNASIDRGGSRGGAAAGLSIRKIMADC